MQDLIDLRSPRPGPTPKPESPPQDFSFQPVVPPIKLGQVKVRSLLDDTEYTTKDQPVTPPTLGLRGLLPESMPDVPTAELIFLTTPRPAQPDESQTDQTPSAQPSQQRTEASQAAGASDTAPSCAPRRDQGTSPLTSPPSSPANPAPSNQAAADPQLAKELEEARSQLRKLEASWKAQGLELGVQRAHISQLEGSKGSLQRQLTQTQEEVTSLKARLERAESALREATVAAGVTPERCRVSARALTEETQRADQLRQEKEKELQRARDQLDYETREMKHLKDFMAQERLTLIRVNEDLTLQLSAAKDAEASVRTQCTELTRKLEQTQRELKQTKAEAQDQSAQIWKLNNTMIEVQAELGQVKLQVANSRTAELAAQEHAQREVEARQRAAAESREALIAGVKLYKQIRAVAHALDGHMHHFQPIPKVALSVRSLQDWCNKQAPFWNAQAAAVAADAEADTASAAAAAAAAQPAATSAPPPPGSLGDETLNLQAALARLPANSTGAAAAHAPMSTVKRR